MEQSKVDIRKSAEYTLTDRPQYSQIDALRGIAIFLVVLGHSIILYPIDLHQNDICLFIFNWLSSVHMPLFFAISGFCFSYRGNYKTFIWKKVKRLLIPYIVFNMIDVIPRYLLSSLVNRPRGIGESLKRMVFNGGEYWFLYTLFIIFLIYPFIYKLIKNNRYKFIGLLFLLLIARFCMPSISIFNLSSVITNLFYFSIGVIVKEIFGGKIFDVILPPLKKLIFVILLLIVWISLLRIDLSYTNVISALVGIITLYIGVQTKIITDIFKRFGKYSLQLYLLNGYLLVISRTIIVSILGVSNPFIIILFNMFVDFFVSYIVIKYLCERVKGIRILMGM